MNKYHHLVIANLLWFLSYLQQNLIRLQSNRLDIEQILNIFHQYMYFLVQKNLLRKMFLKKRYKPIRESRIVFIIYKKIYSGFIKTFILIAIGYSPFLIFKFKNVIILRINVNLIVFHNCYDIYIFTVQSTYFSSVAISTTLIIISINFTFFRYINS